MKFIKDDGGRAAAGYQGTTGDCVARSIAIASGRPYQEVYDRLAEGSVGRKWFKDYMTELGFEWTPTMTIGSGCKVHLKDGELPMGRLVVSVSKHSCAVIDGVLHDLSDCSRSGTRCVYGYYKLKN